ncbi:MAG: hypothetical protein IT364_06655 [Candidatus Hydrogenedentes bacterium]|nr:hypothetical protein [Candidatus Hydrogenedentota bacterium]
MQREESLPQRNWTVTEAAQKLAPKNELRQATIRKRLNRAVTSSALIMTDKRIAADAVVHWAIYEGIEFPRVYKMLVQRDRVYWDYWRSKSAWWVSHAVCLVHGREPHPDRTPEEQELYEAVLDALELGDRREQEALEKANRLGEEVIPADKYCLPRRATVESPRNGPRWEDDRSEMFSSGVDVRTFIIWCRDKCGMRLLPTLQTYLDDVLQRAEEVESNQTGRHRKDEARKSEQCKAKVRIVRNKRLSTQETSNNAEPRDRRFGENTAQAGGTPPIELNSTDVKIIKKIIENPGVSSANLVPVGGIKEPESLKNRVCELRALGIPISRGGRCGWEIDPDSIPKTSPIIR